MNFRTLTTLRLGTGEENAARDKAVVCSRRARQMGRISSKSLPVVRKE